MNNLQDVKEIVEKYYTRGGQLLEKATSKTAAKDAEQLWTEGLAKLNTLKLSPADRSNFRLLRDSFKLAIKSAQALQKGQNHKAELLAEESADYAHRYSAVLINMSVTRNE